LEFLRLIDANAIKNVDLRVANHLLMRHPLYPNLDMMECKYTPRLGAEAVHLLKEGKSFSAVGRALGVHRDTIKNWGKRYDLELGKAVVEAKQCWGRETSMNEALDHLSRNPLKRSEVVEKKVSPSSEELEREKRRRIFQEMEGRHQQQMLKEERELSERETMPPEMQGFWLG
jgi:transposase